jgi:hypothetical protein
MAAELADRLAIFVTVRRFPGMGVADSRSLRSESYVRMQHFVRRTTSIPFGVFLRMCGKSLCNVFLLLFMVLWAPISAMLCRRAVLMQWHAFLFLGLRFFPFFFFLLGGLCCFFVRRLPCKRMEKEIREGRFAWAMLAQNAESK